MKHDDHVGLIRGGVSPGGVWADFGSGEGAFTLAVADLAGETVEIFSIDQDHYRLESQKEAFNEMFPTAAVHYLNEDFTQPLALPELDGILMANSLHYVRDQVGFLTNVKRYLKPHGSLLIVEYNAPIEHANKWVPYPVPFTHLEHLTHESGFSKPKLLHSVPSTFHNEIYAAIASLL